MAYKFSDSPGDTFKSHIIFPTMVATVDNLSIPNEDHEKILNSEFKVTRYGNFPTTENKFILDTVPTLKSWIQVQINRYASEIMGTSTLRITQSWAIKHENQPQSIYTHTHANSIISGSYYIDAPENTEPLTLMRPVMHGNSPQIEWEKDWEGRPWLYDQIKYSAYTGRLIMFPSNVPHGVLGQQSTNQRRCVLAFNTWFADPIGSKESLTYLD
jgi:uncharacterized protein (TIGR02466 family)